MPGRGVDHSVSDFARYVTANARGPLTRALVLLLAASMTEGLSLLLIVPAIGLLSPGSTSLDIQLPRLLRVLIPGNGHLHLDLRLALVGFAVLVTLRGLAVRAKDIEVTNVLYTIVNDLRIRLFSALGGTRWGYISSLRVSDLNHALTADIDRIQTATMQLLLLTQALVLIAVYTCLSLVVSVWMTIFAVLVGLAILLVLHPIRRRARAYGQSFLAARQEQFATVDEFLGAMKIVKAANAENAYVARLARGLDSLRVQTLSYLRLSSLATLIFQVVTAIAVSGFVAVAFLELQLSREKIILQLVLFLRLGPRIMSLQQEMQDILVNMSSFSAMRRLETACLDNAEARDARIRGPALHHAIELENVCFQHLSAETRTLSDITARIPAGQTTALIAASGGGKSTLADLLLGLHAPDSGAIRVDGVALAGPMRRAWRDEVAYVPQEVFLLNDTVAANLRLTSPAASEEELWAALAAAQLDRVIGQSTLGLQTLIGDRGVRLSGGERQRLALARALLRKPQLLLLDEATSALDWENQAAIARVIAGLRGLCTVVTIAHRPSMIDFADWVIALEQGRVVESGRYEVLAADPSSHLARLLAGEAR